MNVRDLGGFETARGPTRSRRVVRSDNPARLTEKGWSAVWDHGVRTVITLRTIGAPDPEPDRFLVPDGIVVERIEIEDATDPDFRRRCIDTGWWTTPLQWTEMLQHWPERCAGAVTAIARAGRGGVVVSCGVGRDRTGLVTFLLLALAGVPAVDIAEDWARSNERLATDPIATELPVMSVLERENTTPLAAVEAALALDVEGRLIAGGLDPQDLVNVRARLLATFAP